MSQLDVMKDEIKQMDEVRVEVLERLIQIPGDLYEYSPFLNEDILRAKDVFLAIDRVGEFDYLLNIVDLAGKLSYTRKALKNQGDF